MRKKEGAGGRSSCQSGSERDKSQSGGKKVDIYINQSRKIPSAKEKIKKIKIKTKPEGKGNEKKRTARTLSSDRGHGFMTDVVQGEEREREEGRGGESGGRTVRPRVPHELLDTTYSRLRNERHRPSTSRDEQELHKRLRYLRNDDRRRRRLRFYRRHHFIWSWSAFVRCRWSRRATTTATAAAATATAAAAAGDSPLVAHVDVIACGSARTRVVVHTGERRARARGQHRDLDRDGTGERREGSLAMRGSGVIVHRGVGGEK